MVNKEHIIRIVREELPFLRHEFGVRKIALFGSFVRGRQHQGSDVDILVEFAKPIGLGYFDLVEYLRKKIGRKVDVLTAGALSNMRVKSIARDIRKSLVYV